MYQLKISLLGLPKTTNAHARAHWRQLQQEAMKWQRATILAIAQDKPIAPCQRAKLVLTRHSSKEPDFDGLVSSFKHCIDALKIAGVIIDDKMSVIGQPEYRWQKAPRGDGSVTIEVVEVTRDEVKDDALVAQG